MDTPQVLAFTRRIWEGEDYVPYVWEERLADSEGLLAIAQYGSAIVAMSKLTQIDTNQWWLEGLRVHPDFQGRGVASRLHEYLLEYWRRHGSGIIRLATFFNREPIKHLAMRSGFHPVASYIQHWSPLHKNLNPRQKGLTLERTIPHLEPGDCQHRQSSE